MTEIKSQIKNLDSLERACERLGLTLHRESRSATYYSGQRASCDHTISIPGTQYQVGVKQAADGTYSLLADTYDPTLRRAVGDRCAKLTQAYNIEESRRQARMKGMDVTERVLEDGTIRLEVQVGRGE
jgi:hypothetical protein